MAQVRKYFVGGKPEPVDEAPLKIYNNFYDKDTLKTIMLGTLADNFIQRMGFNKQEAEAFKETLNTYVDGIINGNLKFEGDEIVDYNGQIGNKKQFDPFEKNNKLNTDNNKSIFVTNYLVGNMKSTGFLAQRPLKSEYKIDINNIFKNHFYSDVKTDSERKTLFENLDTVDETSKKRNSSERIKKLGELLEAEAKKLNLDLKYKNKFDYKNQYNDLNNWGNRQNYIVDQLTSLSEKLRDGVIDENDKKAFLESGINFEGFKKHYLVEDTEESKKLQQELEAKEIAEKEAKQAEENTRKSLSLFTSNYKDILFKDKLTYNHFGTDYVGDQIDYSKMLDAENLGAYLNWFDTFLGPAGHENNYYLDYTSMFNNLNDNFELRKTLSNPFDYSNAGYTIRWINNDLGTPLEITHNITDIFMDNRGDWYAVIGNNKRIKLGKQNKNAEPENIFKRSSDLENNLRKFRKLRNLNHSVSSAKDVLQSIIDAKNSDGSNVSHFLLDADTKNKLIDLKINIPEGSTDYFLVYAGDYIYCIFANRDKNVFTGYLYYKKRVLKNQYGGVISGGLKTKQEKEQDKNRKYEKINDTTIGVTNSKKQQLVNEGMEFDWRDQTRLGSSLLDLASTVAGFIPGLNIASAAIGGTSSIATAIANYTDKDVSWWDATKNTMIDLGLDSVSLLIPGGKAAKTTRIISNVMPFITHAMGAIQAGHYMFDEESRASMLHTLNKVSKFDVTDLTQRDIDNLVFLGRSALAGKNIFKAHKNSKGEKGLEIVTGEVKVNGTKYKVLAHAPESSHNKVKIGAAKKDAREALAKAANEDPNIPKNKGDDGKEINFKSDDIDLNTSGFRTKVSHERIPIEVLKPKRVGQGVLGSMGYDVWFSDKRLSDKYKWARRVLGVPDSLEEYDAFKKWQAENEIYEGYKLSDFSEKEQYSEFLRVRNKSKKDVDSDNEALVRQETKTSEPLALPYAERLLLPPPSLMSEHKDSKLYKERLWAIETLKKRKLMAKAEAKAVKKNNEEINKLMHSDPRLASLKKKDMLAALKSKEGKEKINAIEEKIRKREEKAIKAIKAREKNERNRLKNAERRKHVERKKLWAMTELAAKVDPDFRNMGSVERSKYLKDNKKILEMLMREQNRQKYQSSKHMYGGILNQKQFNFFLLLSAYKNGGILINKFQDGGWLDKVLWDKSKRYKYNSTTGLYEEDNENITTDTFDPETWNGADFAKNLSGDNKSTYGYKGKVYYTKDSSGKKEYYNSIPQEYKAAAEGNALNDMVTEYELNKTSGTSEFNTDKQKDVNKINFNSMYGHIFAGAASAMAGNIAAYEPLKDIKPFHKTPFTYNNTAILSDRSGVYSAYNLAGQNYSAVKDTSDPIYNFLMRQSVNAANRGIIQNAENIAAQSFATSKEKVDSQNKTNLLNINEADNAKKLADIALINANKLLDSSLINTLFTRVFNPLLAQLGQLAATHALENARNDKTSIEDENDSKYSAYLNDLDNQFLGKVKLSNFLTGSDNTPYDYDSKDINLIMLDLMMSNDPKAKELVSWYTNQNRLINSEKTNELIFNLKSLNDYMLPWWVSRKYSPKARYTDTGNGIYEWQPAYKSGGKLTAKDKEKIEKIKQKNKNKRLTQKINNDNIQKSLDRASKEQRAALKGIFELVKMAMQK